MYVYVYGFVQCMCIFTFHGPVVDGGLCHQGDGVEIDPLPKDDVIGHLVCLHTTLHLNVEDLKTLAS